MNNRELKKIIETISSKEKNMDLKGIAERAKVNRSHLSTIINDKKVRIVTAQLEEKLRKKFPKYFPKVKANDTMNLKDRKNDEEAFTLTFASDKFAKEVFKKIVQLEAIVRALTGIVINLQATATGVKDVKISLEMEQTSDEVAESLYTEWKRKMST